MLKKTIILLIFLQVQTCIIFAQKDFVHVNQFTGTASVILPLFDLKRGAVSIPVSLVYSGTGIKVKDVEGTAGMGWNINVGGSIDRDLRGLPDDCKKDQTNNVRLGWLYNNNGTSITNFSLLNDNNQSTCIDEQSDLNFLNNFSDMSDTEPDFFLVNAPGLSCRLVFDNNHVIRVVPYQDLKITYLANDVTGLINSFTITNDKGLKYFFTDVVKTNRKTQAQIPSNVTFFNTGYQQYKNGIDYVSSWKLTGMSDPNGNTCSLFYTNGLTSQTGAYQTFSNIPVDVIVGNPSGYTKESQYIIKEINSPLTLLKVGISPHLEDEDPANSNINFVYDTSPSSHQPIIRLIRAYGKQVNFTYGNVGTGYRRAFLSGLFANYDEQVNVRFDYLSGSSQGQGIEYIALPDSSSKEIDYWGYFNANSSTSLAPLLYINPSDPLKERYRHVDPGNSALSFPYMVPGSNRQANSSAVMTGALNKIIYNEGGNTSLVYESNEFYDPTAGTIVSGGGIRIKRIADFDDATGTESHIRNFAYINPITGLSSGKPVILPVYSFMRPYTGAGTQEEIWNYSTVRMEENLSPGDNSIIYSHVRESVPGQGNTLYEYTVPATSWDANFTADYFSTVTYFARPSCSVAGMITSDRNTYPFPPDTNFEFERGLIKKVSNWNENGQPVNETVYSYQRTGVPLIVYGLKVDDNSGIKAYAKYSILTSCSQQISNQITKSFDPLNAAVFSQNIKNYLYSSPYHKQLTSQESNKSDGSIERIYFKYVKDYTAGPESVNDAAVLYNLQQLNVNTPIETYQQVERNGINRTLKADFLKFSAFGTNLWLPSQQLSLPAANGIIDFIPSSLSSGTIVTDPRYIVTQNNLGYDSYGNLLSMANDRKEVQTVITDPKIMLPVATFSGAAYQEIAYNDFDSEFGDKYGFTTASMNSLLSLNGRTGARGAVLTSSNILSKSILKNTGVKNYIFSAWIKGGTGSGNINLSLLNVNNQTFNQVLPFANSTEDWKYYEMKVPVTEMTSNFTVRVQFSAAFSASVKIDDVLFYPENAEAMTTSYDPVTHVKTSETNTNGVPVYYSFDIASRLKYVYDQDRNIIKRNTYISKGNFLYHTSEINFTPETNINFNTDVLFKPEGWYGGSSDTWNFGDGTPSVTASGDIVHRYPRAGSYIVTLTQTSPVFGQKTAVPKQVNVGVLFSYVKAPNNSVGFISQITFSKVGGGTQFTLSGTSLTQGVTFPPGVYNVNVTFTRSNLTFKGISMNNTYSLGCIKATRTGSQTASVQLDLSSSPFIRFKVEDVSCELL